MKKINGNIDVEIKVKTTTKNKLGEQVEAWETVDTLKNGVLSLSSGDSKYIPYYAKIQESTHVYLADYKVLDERIKAETSRIFVPKTNKWYDVMLIDNVEELDTHYEIYLKYVGGQ